MTTSDFHLAAERIATRSNAIERAALRLNEAHESNTPCEPVRDLLGSSDLDAAYQVQRAVVQQLRSGGTQIVGRKIGMTSRAVQAQLGVDQPDFGILLESMQRPDGARLALDQLIQPKIEVEIAFTLSHDLNTATITAEQVLDATAYVSPALEIVDSRIRDWDISIVDTVADNGSAGLFILGETRQDPRKIDLAAVTMELERGGDLVSCGSGADCLGSPVNAVLWLARQAYSVGDPLRAGAVILSGALGPMVPLAATDHYQAHLSNLGVVTATVGRAL